MTTSLSLCKSLSDYHPYNSAELKSINMKSFIPGAKSSFWMLADYAVLDPENGLWTCANYSTFNVEEISLCTCESYSKKLFIIAEKLQNLHLTTGEVNILRAIVLFNSGTISSVLSHSNRALFHIKVNIIAPTM